MADAGFLERDRFQALIDALADAGYRCLGPVVGDGAFSWQPIERAAQLPRGMSDEQSPGHYRLHASRSVRWFDWAVGPQCLKPLLFEPRAVLWQVRSVGGRLEFMPEPVRSEPTAVIGVRACDLAALKLQDAHFCAADARYAARREALFLVAVNCARPAATCFCASTGDGPAVQAGYDLLLDELDEGFLVTAGSEAGRAIAGRLPLVAPRPEQPGRARAQVEAAAAAQQRALPGRDLRTALVGAREHPHWQAVAERCLACGNCTSVCPTCFCHSHHDEPALDGQSSAQVREWDSCFTAGHSYIHGIVIRATTAHRYRQWLTHKLATWHDQYGRSGCVGCGRCITWCSVGIDLTAEIAALLEPAGA